MLLAVLAHPVPASAESLINAAGSTFAYPLYSRWFKVYSRESAEARFTYDPVGSSEGVRRITARRVDFGASDGPMMEEQIQAAGGRILHIPVALGAVVATYNLPGSPELRFTPDLLADVFLGKIAKWNDGRIRDLNPGVDLPALDLKVVHRSDGSGTTYILADYLSKVSAEWHHGCCEWGAWQHSRRFPRLPDRCTGRGELPDREFHVGARIPGAARRDEGQGPREFPVVGHARWTDLRPGPELRTVAAVRRVPCRSQASGGELSRPPAPYRSVKERHNHSHFAGDRHATWSTRWTGGGCRPASVGLRKHGIRGQARFLYRDPGQSTVGIPRRVQRDRGVQEDG
ncbi:MAG: phosphate ABC transporter substrate-binding protein PstS [Candidatus Limnocylindria bacterium]